MAISVFDLFKIGIGPSSSHTVGPMIAARKFVLSLEESNQLKKVTRIRSEMFGSLGATGKAHGTPKAIILGMEGEQPDQVDASLIAQRIEKIQNEALADVNNAFAYADTQPWPKPEDTLEEVYVNYPSEYN